MHNPIPGQPAALVVENGVYLARYPFDVDGEVSAFQAARRWLANARSQGLHLDATVEEFDGKGDPAAAVIQAARDLLAEFGGDVPHWLQNRAEDLAKALETYEASRIPA